MLSRYVKTTHSVVLDYAVDVHVLSEQDLQLSFRRWLTEYPNLMGRAGVGHTALQARLLPGQGG